jgi:hypothetical protein
MTTTPRRRAARSKRFEFRGWDQHGRTRSVRFAQLRAAQKEIAKRLRPQHIPEGHGQPARTIPAAAAVRLETGFTVWEDSVEITSADQVIAPPKRRRGAHTAVNRMRRPS